MTGGESRASAVVRPPQNLADLRVLLAQVVTDIDLEDLHELVGLLEGAKVRALGRLTTAGTSQSATSALVDAEEMARRADLPVFWIRDRARRRQIPSVRCGRYVRFDPDAVIAALHKTPDLRRAK